ncbi:hypothetical protein L2E82_50513 [Cichorium intybus]|nr:hypothetical protein L2E82_50513 [Cichorium intybus]
MTSNSSSSEGANLDKFFDDVEAIKDELRALETLHNQLQSSHEHSKTLHNAKFVKELRSNMRSQQLIGSRSDLCKYRETVQRRYYTVTGENPDESTVDNLISTGQSKTFLQKAIQEQGRGQVMDTILESKELLIQKRVPCLFRTENES